jgi:hypothetical protein
MNEMETLVKLLQATICSLERYMNDGLSTQQVIVGENEDYRITSAQDRIDRKKREIERDRKLIRVVKSTLSRRKMLDSQRKKKK